MIGTADVSTKRCKGAHAGHHIKTLETYSFHIRVRTFAIFGDEAVDPRRDNGQRYRAELEHRIVESADVEFETRSLPNLLVATLATLP
jgi:hypothetical protein